MVTDFTVEETPRPGLINLDIEQGCDTTLLGWAGLHSAHRRYAVASPGRRYCAGNIAIGSLLTDGFLRLAEHSGLILPMGHWVIGKAFEALNQWRDAGINCRLSINLSDRG
jgi:hypothetical protein